MRNRIAVLAILAATLLPIACSKDPAKVKAEAFASGEKYFAAQQYKEATLEYRRAVQADPNYGEARAKLGETYLKTGDIAGALRETVRAADLLPKRADLQIRAGNLLLAAAKYEDARTRAENVLSSSPQDVEALVLRGNAMAGLKDLDGALTEFEKAAAADPKRGLVLSSIGAVQMAKGATVDAEAAFRKATEVSPDSTLARVSYAYFLLAKKQPEAAEDQLKQALASSPKDSTVRRALVLLYLSTGRSADAEPHLRAIADDSQEPQARFALARFYVAINRDDDALRELKVLAANKGVAIDANLEIAALQYRRGQTSEARRLLDEVLKESPSHARGRLLEAEFLVRERKWPEAIRSANAAIAADPRLVAAQFVLGAAQQGQGDLAAAKQAFNEVLKLEPNATRAQLALAELHLLEHDAVSALPLATTAAASAPQSIEARTTLVSAMLANRNLTGAAEAIKTLKSDFPNSEMPFVLDGTLQMLRQDLVAADKSFAKASQINPASMPAARGRVQLLLVSKKRAEAGQYVDRLVALNPDKVEVLVLAARTHAALGDYAKAEPLLQKALELDSANAEVYALLAQVYLREGKTDQALAQYLTLADKQPKSVGARTLVGTIYQMTNRRTEAKAAYRQVLAINATAPVAANNLAWMLAEDNEDLDTALQLAQAAKAGLPNSPEAADTLGFVYLKKGLADQAVQQFSEAVSKEPATAGFHYRLGFAYAKSGQLTDARRSLEKGLALDANAPEAVEARDTLARLARVGS